MRLDQFKFEPSLKIGYDEEAKQPTGEGIFVELLKKPNVITVIKTMHNKVVYNVSFMTDKNTLELDKALKNISKRK